MKARLEKHDGAKTVWTLRAERDEKDKPLVERQYDSDGMLISNGSFNEGRRHYTLMFDSEAEAQKALAKVQSIGDFDKAAAWLDKQ